MSVPRGPNPVMLFFAVLGAPEAPVEALMRRLEMEFSPMAHASAPYAFDESAYYEPEMGPNLRKCLWCCAQPILPDELVGIKLHTNRLEAHFASQKGRRLNIDPGYLDLARVVLATGKDSAHRIYAGQGIFEEITLLFHRKAGFEALPWTYPDYRRGEALVFFNEAREIFYQGRKEAGCTSI